MSKKKGDGVDYSAVPTDSLVRFRDNAITEEAEWGRAVGTAMSSLARAERMREKWSMSLRSIRRELARRETSESDRT